jgi:hypothetical protein
MRRPIHLTFDAVVALLGRTLEALPDSRDPDRLTYPMRDAALSAFAMFFFQHPSLLKFQQEMTLRSGRSNLESLFGVRAVPSDSQLREILDGAPYEPLRRLLGRLFERFRRSGWAAEFKTSQALGALYPVALDGTDYFSSTKIECPSCLRAEISEGTTLYRHAILAATLVKSRAHQILPLDAEPIANTDGEKKQDCEITAGKRVVARLRREHPKLPLLVLGDSNFSHEPFLLALSAARMNFLLMVKPGSHQELFEWVEDLEQRTDWVERGSWAEGPASKRRFFEYRICREVPVNADRRTWVTFVEVWERDRSGKVVYHGSWMTDLEVTRETVAEVSGLGRARWRIENEQFNVHKNGGYQLEHNFGHGHETLATVFYFLNLLAFVTHEVLARSDREYLRLRRQETRRELWNGLRYCFRRFAVGSWAELLRVFDPEQAGASP